MVFTRRPESLFRGLFRMYVSRGVHGMEDKPRALAVALASGDASELEIDDEFMMEVWSRMLDAEYDEHAQAS
eukprot:355101-Chlamydomonas_euryale.AAC.4